MSSHPQLTSVVFPHVKRPTMRSHTHTYTPLCYQRKSKIHWHAIKNDSPVVFHYCINPLRVTVLVFHIWCQWSFSSGALPVWWLVTVDWYAAIHTDWQCDIKVVKPISSVSYTTVRLRWWSNGHSFGCWMIKKALDEVAIIGVPVLSKNCNAACLASISLVVKLSKKKIHKKLEWMMFTRAVGIKKKKIKYFLKVEYV